MLATNIKRNQIAKEEAMNRTETSRRKNTEQRAEYKTLEGEPIGANSDSHIGPVPRGALASSAAEAAA